MADKNIEAVRQIRTYINTETNPCEIEKAYKGINSRWPLSLKIVTRL